jgi:hypothetical protein
MSCEAIFAGRDARLAGEAQALANYLASLTCTPAWNNQCGNNFPRPAPQTSEEAYCDAYEKSCRLDAGGTFNAATDTCENYTPWNIDPSGTVKTVYTGEMGNPTVETPAPPLAPAAAAAAAAPVTPGTQDGALLALGLVAAALYLFGRKRK